jgi:bacteriorhodopsin
MKKSTKVFWISFAVYSILTFIVTLMIERNQNNLGFLINMKGYIPIMKYYTFLGLLFFAVSFYSMWRNRSRNTKMLKRLEEEKKDLKAAMFDLNKKSVAPPPVQEEADSPEPEE